MASRTITVGVDPEVTRINKAPDEVLRGIAIDFSAKLQTGETLTGVAIDDAGTGLVTFSARAGTVATVALVGGNNGEIIPATVTVTGSAGSVRQAMLYVRVIDPLAAVAPILITRNTLTVRYDYAPTAGYRQNDLVRHNGAWWLSTTNQVGVTPANGVPGWTYFAASSGSSGQAFTEADVNFNETDYPFNTEDRP